MLFEVEPELEEHLEEDDVADDELDEVEHDEAVLAEVVAYEQVQVVQVVEEDAGRVLLEYAHLDAQVLVDKEALSAADEHVVYPGGDVGHRHEHEEYHPEPEYDEELLDEQVDGQDALRRVAVDLAQILVHEEVAEGHDGKLLGGGERVHVVVDLGEELEAEVEHVEVEEVVQAGHLHQHVEQIEALEQEHADGEVLRARLGRHERDDLEVLLDCRWRRRLLLLLLLARPSQALLHLLMAIDVRARALELFHLGKCAHRALERVEEVARQQVRHVRVLLVA